MEQQRLLEMAGKQGGVAAGSMRRGRPVLASAVLLTFTLTACGPDLVGPEQPLVDPEDTPTEGSVADLMSQQPTPFVCYSATRLDIGGARPLYRHARFWVSFPETILSAAGGKKQSYRLHAETEAGEPWGTLTCSIPAVAAAVDFMNDMMGVGRIFQRREEEAEGGPMRGPCNPVCQIPGLVVTVPAGYGGTLYPDFSYSPSYIPDSGSDYDSYDPNPCDPRVDVDCEKPLSPEDIDKMRDAGQHFQTQYGDESKAEMCNAMKSRFEQKLAAGEVYRGNTDLPAPPHPLAHRSAWDPATGNIHFDPSYLDSTSLRDLMNSMLHEAAHDLGHVHSTPVGPYYAEYPFNLLSPGTDSCIKW